MNTSTNYFRRVFKFPTLVENNSRNVGVVNPKRSSNHLLGFAVRVSQSNFRYFFPIEPNMRGLLSVFSVVPSFFRHVPHVVLMGSEEKMFRIYTSGVVALVKHLHVCWNRGYEHHVRGPMRLYVFCSLGFYHSVMAAVFTATPLPAIVTNGDFADKPFGEVVGKTLFREIRRASVHLLESSLGCFGPRSRLARARGHFFYMMPLATMQGGF